MSTLAQLTPNLDEAKSAAYRVLQPDATLQGATYLDGTDRVVAQEQAPVAIRDVVGSDGLRKPRLHIVFQFPRFDAYTAGTDLVMELRAVVSNREHGVSGDRARLGRILARAGVVVVGKGVFTATGYNFHDSWLENATDVLVDPKAPEESYQSNFVRVRFRKT